MGRLISMSFCLLLVFHSFGLPCASRVVAESLSQHGKSITRSPSNSSDPSNSTDAYSASSTQTESPVETSDTPTSNPSPETEGNWPTTWIVPETTLSSSTNSSIKDEQSNYTIVDSSSVSPDSSTTARSELNSTHALHPWMKLSRMTREDEMSRAEVADSNSIGELKELDSERVSFVTESSSVSVYESPEEDAGNKNSPERESKDAEETLEKGENFVESPGSADDRFGAVYPYLYRQEFLRERFWPIYRKHPYNSYVKYPIFPGK